MSGSVPPPPNPNSPGHKSPGKRAKSLKRRRAHSALPWLWLITLFIVYALAGLLLSASTSPWWLWVPASIGAALMIVGVHRPVLSGYKRSGCSGIFIYLTACLGALALVIALAIAANYVGSDQAFDDVDFFTAIFLLAFLTLLSIVLTATAAIFSAKTGANLLEFMGYASSLAVLLGTSFLGLFVGGLTGYLTVGSP